MLGLRSGMTETRHGGSCTLSTHMEKENQEFKAGLRYTISRPASEIQSFRDTNGQVFYQGNKKVTDTVEGLL